MDPHELAERRRELETYWESEGGFRERLLIEMVPLPTVSEQAVIDKRLIVGTEDPELRKVAEQFAGYFKRELRFDFVPFTADDFADGDEVLLINSRKVIMLSPVACGAVGFNRRENCLRWVWVHPFERGTGLMGHVWDILERRYGNEFWIETPVSPPMQKFLQSREVDMSRWGGPSPGH
ncbi:hypothetical protein OG887_39005 [Streptomyces sp. NBC_00053]|uniref:hypothetical protein n=1 Tax=unclassified Streptomyces TaxID=2593676 RepID=UPI000F5C168A|nr:MULTISPECIES: hypothetical protein [unclassified Streptomyces]WSG55358.1 hypothetical protein OHA38_39250 [Streptomyces sp. NBC_01732]WSX06494.1 hypothetical protein OG355_42130 [Streptomyces sp. NBC_00987]MCX4391635.1 hypothetical protein [Streptomyces sp. NBC_01767]MCX5103278.1 hypothetical protein [Streptomyces sp. NBC_00439]MCX5505295.1 hypothetical protein [Streptomyces sp. NBC_00052]